MRGIESGYDLYQAWTQDDFPKVIVVTFQHATPYYDTSYAVNSVNHGPYGAAIMTEVPSTCGSGTGSPSTSACTR